MKTRCFGFLDREFSLLAISFFDDMHVYTATQTVGPSGTGCTHTEIL